MSTLTKLRDLDQRTKELLAKTEEQTCGEILEEFKTVKQKYSKLNQTGIESSSTNNTSNEFHDSLYKRIKFIEKDISHIIKSLEKKSTQHDQIIVDIESEWKKLRADIERIDRTITFSEPKNQEEFEKALMWMIEKGGEEELNLINEIRANPRYNSSLIRYLFKQITKQNFIVRKNIFSQNINTLKNPFLLFNLISVNNKIFDCLGKLLTDKFILREQQHIDLLSRIDQKEISLKIDGSNIEEQTLTLGKSYIINIQVLEPQAIASDFFQKLIEKFLATFNLKKGLDTEWVVSSSTVKLAAINTKTSLTTTAISQDTAWVAKFQLYVPLYGDSAVFPLEITSKVVQDARLSILIYASSNLYHQFFLKLNVVSADS